MSTHFASFNFFKCKSIFKKHFLVIRAIGNVIEFASKDIFVVDYLIDPFGNGDNRVKGKTPVIDAMCIKDCAIISITIPETKSLLKASGELLAIRNPRKAKSKKRNIVPNAPTKPNSSPKTAKMESPCGSGR